MDCRQVIIRTNARNFFIGTLETNIIEILNEIHTFPFKKMHMKNLPNGGDFVSASMC